MNICAKCVLPETFPGIRFSADGVCNHCHDFEHHRRQHDDGKRRCELRFRDLIVRMSRSGHNGSHPYDVIAAYSGGRDSTYILQVLRWRYGLKALAVTFDHGFLPAQAREDIRAVTGALKMDHVMLSANRKALFQAFRESAFPRLYPEKILEQASAICTTCMSLVKSAILRMALDLNIPFIVYGWSPGQAPIQSSVMKLNASLVREGQAALVNALWKIMGKDLEPFLLGKRHYAVLEGGPNGDGPLSFYAVYPRAFLEYRKDHGNIQEPGWKWPRNIDYDSAHCLLCAFADQVHLEQHGFHPKAFEVASLVRQGRLSRDEGFAKLAPPADLTVLSEVKQKLGLDDREGGGIPWRADRLRATGKV